jgi:hypothetical protein
VVGDQAVAEAERRLDVVDDFAPGLRERVRRDPVRAARVLAGLVSSELDAQIGGAARQHPPHVPRLRAGEVAEHRIAEVRVGRVARGHRVAVLAVERCVEALEELVVGMGHGPSLSDVA